MTIATIILAGGKGTRMHSADRHKVCFEINGRPAINRAIDTYKQCGIDLHVVVVGALAGQVVETVGRAHEGVIFAYQSEQRGTGHAARQGARILQDLRFDGAVLVVAGDRLLDAQVVEQLISEFRSTAADLMLLTGKRGQSELGHVIRDAQGGVLGIVEHRDVVAKRALAELRTLALQDKHLSADQALAVLQRAFPRSETAELAFGEMWKWLSNGGDVDGAEILVRLPEESTTFRFGEGTHGVTVTAEEADLSDEANRSVYLVRASALYSALASLTDDNAQREQYLPDIVNFLAHARHNGRSHYKIQTMRVDNPTLVMGFNNPAELLEIENTLRAREAGSVMAPGRGLAFRTVREWQALFASESSTEDSEPLNSLMGIYGDHEELVTERHGAYQELLSVCAERLGLDRPVLIARAPGRINIMGRHIDHQGGFCNLMAIDREVLVAVAARDDDEVCLHNVRPEQFGERSFSMRELLAELTWDDWLALVNSDRVREMVKATLGDWAQYVRAAVLRLQKQYHDIKLQGFDMVVHGTIPVAAGLSSSSAIVVATAEAVAAINGLDIRPRQFVDLCGEGEWFVGTRGGAADHAAMKFAQRDAVINVGFLPFVVGEAVPFPAGYRLVFCNSHIRAQKAAAARDVFNQRVACYHIGVHLIRQMYPQYAPLIRYLRDINTRQLPVRLVEIYRMLLKLPERATGEDLKALLPEKILEPLVANHSDVGAVYPIRGVVFFGLAESERGRLFPQILTEGSLADIGRLMNISHDGDRVVQHDAEWRVSPFRPLSDNAYLLDLMADLESGEPGRVLGAQLHLQPGAYSCSMPELDLIVDIAHRTEGVVGAQLAGAGLGGGIMVLVREDAIPALREGLVSMYYAPRDLEPAILPCIPIAGSGLYLPRAGRILRDSAS